MKVDDPADMDSKRKPWVTLGQVVGIVLVVGFVTSGFWLDPLIKGIQTRDGYETHVQDLWRGAETRIYVGDDLLAELNETREIPQLPRFYAEDPIRIEVLFPDDQWRSVKAELSPQAEETRNPHIRILAELTDGTPIGLAHFIVDNRRHAAMRFTYGSFSILVEENSTWIHEVPTIPEAITLSLDGQTIATQVIEPGTYMIDTSGTRQYVSRRVVYSNDWELIKSGVEASEGQFGGKYVHRLAWAPSTEEILLFELAPERLEELTFGESLQSHVRLEILDGPR